MANLPQNILSQLTNVPHGSRRERCYLTPTDTAPDETLPWSSVDNETSIAFQYWPETLSDSRQSNWNPRNIPGGSHPIYQWTGGGERTLSFVAVFTTDTDPGDEQLNEYNPYEQFAAAPLSGVDLGVRDVDIRSAVSWLRYFTYPMYGQGEDIRVFEPPKAILTMPNSGIGHQGTDHVITVMTQCDVTYEAWFPNGFPRIVEIQLAFAEVVQSGSGVRFHDRQDFYRAGYVGEMGLKVKSD